MSEPPLKKKKTILDYFQRNDKGKSSSKMTSEKGKETRPNPPISQIEGSRNQSGTRSTRASDGNRSVPSIGGKGGAEFDPGVYANDSSAVGLGSSVDGKRSTRQAGNTMATSIGPSVASADVKHGSSTVAGPSKASNANSLYSKSTTSQYFQDDPGPSELGDTLQYSPELFTDSEPMDSQECLPEIPERKPSQRQNNCIWRGVSLPTLKRKPDCMKKMYPLHADDKHTVLFKTGFRYNGRTLPTPHPSHYHDKWDGDHVRMPCSNMNEYPVKGKDGKSVVKRRWEIIEQALKGNIPGPFEFEEAILKYNTRYTDRWNFETLNYFFLDEISREERMHFFEVTLKKIAHLALMLPNLITQPIPLLKRNKNHSITLSQQQIACLLANAFFCTFPRRNAKQKSSEFSNYPSINFNSLYDGYPVQKKLEKLKCIIHYFRRVTEDMPKGTVTFQRQCISYDKFPDWQNLETKLMDLHVSAEGTIEDDGDGLLQVDFANKYLGGGVLGQGCVQEEIRFLICPEMLITRLFTEYLEKNECLLMYGCERFSTYDGYAQTFKWDGDFVDKTERDEWGRLCTDVVAIDALVIHSHGRQFKSDLVRRELNKAYCGFVASNTKSSDELNAVCTGNWGCGAFGGDKRLKALIQLIAASAARRDVCYFTFDDKLLRDELYEIHQYLTQTNRLGIGNILTLIQQYERNVVSKESKKSKPSQNLFQYIPRVFDGSLEMTDSEPDTPTRGDPPTWDDSDSLETRYMLAEQDSESMADEIKKEEEEKGSNSDKPNVTRQHSKDYKADTP